MQCEMCGSEDELFRVSIEDTILNVCKNCSKYGKVLSKVKIEETIEKKKEHKKLEKAKQQPEQETIFVIVPDYSTKIKDKRERLGLKQKDFAKLINERESLVSKLETGSVEPSIKLARKLERVLKTKLVEEYEEKTKALPKIKGEGFTIGDLVKVKKR
ncbi:TIGR00270 family protein [Candidatus Woesearchaeota archaeon RBG_13_36_6]|nr:MAG: TIGR00270 family protein [Candidatus Woesearchaeota archaeon RBG_13_36_6]